MKKRLFIQISLIFFTLIVSTIFFYEIFLNKSTKENIVKKEIINNPTSENLIEGIQYFSKDVRGNIYQINAKSGVLDKENKSIIFLNQVNAKLKFDKKEEILINSDKAVYNIESYDTQFIDNINLVYKDHELTCNKILAKFTENYAILSGNLIYNGLLTSLYADQMEVDFITRTTKTSMYDDKKKIIIKYKNNGTN
mgnify:CR=1 FL=1|tara:strand:- start:142 stop:729 length:588 start_codon:yes stop_codon:yes gene_type:complete